MEMSSPPRLLLPLTYGFSVRYAVPTGLLRQLGEVCRPVVGLGWPDEELAALVRAEGAEVVQLPAAQLSHEYRMFRRRLELVHDGRLHSVTTPIRRRRQRAANDAVVALAAGELRRARDRVELARPGTAERWEAEEPTMIERGTNVDSFRAVLDEHDLDGVLSLTPYHDQDALALWAAERTERLTAVSLISFDNPTTRERWPVRGDRVMVWNRYNAHELQRSYPDLVPGRLSVIGAPQFDLHHMAELRLERAQWCERLSLPTDRPVILYGAGPSQLVPGEDRLVQLIDDAIDDGRVPGRPFLLVRRHPNDPAQPWREVGGRLRHGVVAEPWAERAERFRAWPTHDDLVMQMSSLAHAEVHVNVCSSMTLDGAVFDRPQIGPTFVPGADRALRRRVRELYRQEHWQPIAQSGGLAAAGDEHELVAELALALADPSVRRAGRRRMVQQLLTFDDGAATRRLVDEVALLLNRSTAAS
jgi:hypothetical protein